ncbi:MAG: ATP--guanido phosphotransferase [Armatimonadota bacterium]
MRTAPFWVEAAGPSDDVALSTRARLARNIDGLPFPTRAGSADLERAKNLLLDAARDRGLLVVNTAHLSGSERLALVDAHLASPQHSGRFRPVLLDEAGAVSLMVNEEDHLRLQCILPGMQPLEALSTAEEFDENLGKKIRYAYADNYGYLTSSLANIGTGLRLSVMLHLPALAYLKEAVPALSAAAELKISVRGLLGEGTKALGDIFQVSNETTIGFTPREITQRVRAVAEHLIVREREARERLADDPELTGLVCEVRDHLMEATSLTGREAMAFLSIIRLGRGISIRSFKEFLVGMQIAAESVSSDARRAKTVRERLKAIGIYEKQNQI